MYVFGLVVIIGAVWMYNRRQTEKAQTLEEQKEVRRRNTIRWLLAGVICTGYVFWWTYASKPEPEYFQNLPGQDVYRQPIRIPSDVSISSSADSRTRNRSSTLSSVDSRISNQSTLSDVSLQGPIVYPQRKQKVRSKKQDPTWSIGRELFNEPSSSEQPLPKLPLQNRKIPKVRSKKQDPTWSIGRELFNEPSSSEQSVPSLRGLFGEEKEESSRPALYSKEKSKGPQVSEMKEELDRLIGKLEAYNVPKRIGGRFNNLPEKVDKLIRILILCKRNLKGGLFNQPCTREDLDTFYERVRNIGEEILEYRNQQATQQKLPPQTWGQWLTSFVPQFPAEMG